MLVGVDLAEEGVLRLLFAAVHLISHKDRNDNEVSAASRYFIFILVLFTLLDVMEKNISNNYKP